MDYRYSIDPYVAMLKTSERRATGYGLLAFFMLVITFVVSGISSDGAGQFSPMVEQVKCAVGLGLLGGSGLSGLVSLCFIGRYVYFFKWPERFNY